MAVPFVPFIAESDGGWIVGLVVALLYGLVWFIRRLAEGRSEQQRLAERRRAKEQESQEQPEGYVADQDEVRQFLESLGAQPPARPTRPPAPGPAAAPRPQPSRPPQPAAPAPPRPPARQRERLTLTPLEPEPERRPEPVMKAAPAPPEPPRPAPAPKPQRVRRAEPALPELPMEPQPAPKARQRVTKTAEEEPGQEPAAAETDLFAFPGLSPMQRAIILSDILGKRPPGPRVRRR